MQFDYSKLEGRIKEKIGTNTEFAKKIGISNVSLVDKLKSRVSWKQKEIIRSCETLDISEEEINQYFFTLKVRIS